MSRQLGCKMQVNHNIDMIFKEERKRGMGRRKGISFLVWFSFHLKTLFIFTVRGSTMTNNASPTFAFGPRKLKWPDCLALVRKSADFLGLHQIDLQKSFYPCNGVVFNYITKLLYLPGASEAFFLVPHLFSLDITFHCPPNITIMGYSSWPWKSLAQNSTYVSAPLDYWASFIMTPVI